MTKIIWIIVIGFVVRSIFVAFKKAIAQAKAEIEAEKARQAAESSRTAGPPKSSPVPGTVPQTAKPGEDPRAALLRMLAAAGVSPSVTKVVESTLDYDDDARESRTDYDDDARESRTDYDDEASEDATDYDDDARESVVDYDDDADEDTTDYDDTVPPPPVVAPLPPPPVVYAMPDDATSSAANAYVLKDIRSHVKPGAVARAPIHGLDGENIHSRELVRDSVVLDVLLRRYPHNPFFRRPR